MDESSDSRKNGPESSPLPKPMPQKPSPSPVTPQGSSVWGMFGGSGKEARKGRRKSSLPKSAAPVHYEAGYPVGFESNNVPVQNFPMPIQSPTESLGQVPSRRSNPPPRIHARHANRDQWVESHYLATMAKFNQQYIFDASDQRRTRNPPAQQMEQEPQYYQSVDQAMPQYSGQYPVQQADQNMFQQPSYPSHPYQNEYGYQFQNNPTYQYQYIDPTLSGNPEWPSQSHVTLQQNEQINQPYLHGDYTAPSQTNPENMANGHQRHHSGQVSDSGSLEMYSSSEDSDSDEEDDS